jgi:DNA helicase-2/ATP-dependent DNA helicase PcrA
MIESRTPTAAQLGAVMTTAPRVLCIAGPGSGKTFTLINRIQHLLAIGEDPAGLVVITFTNAAAKEIQDRLGTTTARLLGYLGTLHGFALRELERRGDCLGYGRNITVLDPEQAEAMLVEVAEKLGCKGGLKKLEEARATMAAGGPDRKPRTPHEIAVAKYLQQLRASSAVDFATILADFLILLRRTDQLQTKWEHLIVDEFQDSAPEDVAIYDALHVVNRFFVGDPDQAVYGFRGGRVDYILRMATADGYEVHRLEANYRCPVAVCAAANTLIGRNQNRVAKRTLPALGALKGDVQFLAPFRSDDEERMGILHCIAGRLHDGESPNDIAVLSRGNATALDFAAAAEAMGIPVRKRSLSKLPADWQKARAALDLLNAPTSDLAAAQWIRVAHADRRDAILAMAARNQWALAQVVPEVVPPATHVAGLADALARMGISMDSITRIMDTASAITEPTLAAISFAIARDFESVPEVGHGVTFSTMHSAKGREWPVVYLVACEQEQCPGTSKKRNVEEERRLFFVAVTRSAGTLRLSHAMKRRATWGNRRHEEATRSQFLAELIGAE